MKYDIKKFQMHIDTLEELINAYYAENRNVQNVSFYELKDEKSKPLGYTAKIEYKSFVQNINIFWGELEPFMVNTCFTFSAPECSFICHFADVLDYYDSDDLSCYTYMRCVDKQKLTDAINGVLDATKNYYGKLCEVASNQTISSSILHEKYDEDAINDAKEYPLDKVEEAKDLTFFVYEYSYTTKELKRTLEHSAKKNRLDTRYEKRAYRVLSGESYAQTKSREKNRQENNSFDKKDQLVLAVIFILFAVVFGVLLGYVGYRLELNMFDGWIGKNHGDTIMGFAGVGALLGVLILCFIPVERFKPFLPAKRYENLASFDQTQNVGIFGKIFAVLGVVGLSAFLVFVFCLSGIGFTENQELLYKKYALSQVQTYELKDVEIAIVKGYESKGYNEYGETAYAFKLDGEWVDYGIPNDDANEVIQKAIKDNNKEIKTYKTIEDIE